MTISSPPFSTAAEGRGRSRHSQGFTLIELIVVMFLIGIMLSLSIPTLRNTFYTDPMKASARQIIGLVDGLRDLAVRSQQPYLLHFSRLENRIWYEKDDAPKEEIKDEKHQTNQLLLPETVKIAKLRIGGEENATGDNVVWISKQGYMNDTLIQIEDTAGNHLNIQFYPFLDPALLSDDQAHFE